MMSSSAGAGACAAENMTFALGIGASPGLTAACSREGCPAAGEGALCAAARCGGWEGILWVFSSITNGWGGMSAYLGAASSCGKPSCDLRALLGCADGAEPFSRLSS